MKCQLSDRSSFLIIVFTTIFLRRNDDMGQLVSSAIISAPAVLEGIVCDGIGGGGYSNIRTAAAWSAVAVRSLYKQNKQIKK